MNFSQLLLKDSKKTFSRKGGLKLGFHLLHALNFLGFLIRTILKNLDVQRLFRTKYSRVDQVKFVEDSL